MDDLSTAFLKWAFGADWQRVFVISFRGDPQTAPSGAWSAWQVGALIKAGRWPLPKGNNNYFCVSLFKGDRRQEVDFKSMHVLAIDDVGLGQKTDPGLLLDQLGVPGWSWETSPGNQQWFYRFSPPVVDAVLAKRLSKLVPNDAKDVTRLMRLPVGTNWKPAYDPTGYATRVIISNGFGQLDAEKVLASWDATAVPPADTGGGRLSSKTGVTVEDLIDGDIVGQWLLRLGRVKGLIPSRVGVEIVCPWEAEHSVRTETGAAYFPANGGFECHHGHCAGKTGNDLRSWLEEHLASSGGLFPGGIYGGLFKPVASQDGGGGDGGGGAGGGSGDADQDRPYREMFLEKYVYISEEHKYLDLKAVALLSKEAFDFVETEPMRSWLAYTSGKDTKYLTPHLWWRQNNGRMATKMGHWPGQGEYFQDESGVWVANRFRPWARPLKGQTVTEKDVEPWLELIDAVTANEGPEAAERLKDWFALMVGSFAIKPGWHPIVQSEVHGIGKDMILKPILRVLGEANIARPTASEIAGSFNEFIERRLVSVSDLRRNTRGATTSHDIYETLKPWTENTTRMRDVNPKGAKRYAVLNTSGWFITANADDPMPMDDTDRRFFVIMSTMRRRSDDYYATTDAWIEREWPKVGEFLYQRYETMPAHRRAALLGRAPDTQGKKTMILQGEDPLKAWLRRQIEDGIWQDLMSPRDIEDALEQATRRRVLSHVPAAQKWGPLLRRLGAGQFQSGSRCVPLGATYIRVWMMRCLERYQHLSPHDIAKAYEDLRSLFTP